MISRFLGPLVVAAVVILAGSSGTPAFADNTAAMYHQIALITVPRGVRLRNVESFRCLVITDPSVVGLCPMWNFTKLMSRG